MVYECMCVVAVCTQELRRVVYGSSIHTFSCEWKKAGLIFQYMDTPFPFGLQALRVSTIHASNIYQHHATDVDAAASNYVLFIIGGLKLTCLIICKNF